jgi:hypothetical protein
MVVDVDVPVNPPKITLNALFNNDSVWTLQLLKSKYILDKADFQPITEATVTLFEDGIQFDELVSHGNGYYTSPRNKIPAQGKIYQVQASASGMESIQAQSSIPSSVTPKAIELNSSDGTGSMGEFNHTVDVTFDDDPSAENFYEIELWMESFHIDEQTEDTIFHHWPIYIYTDDPAFDGVSSNGIVFDDKSFNGHEKKLNIKTSAFGSGTHTFYLHFKTLSKDLYKYIVTTQLQENSSGDPFAQPVHVYNNIINGFGIFGGYNEKIVKFTN